jgi:hypothetical protein
MEVTMWFNWTKKKKVFLSYAHDASPEHMNWVKQLSDALRKRSIDTILDQDDLRFGQLIGKFQEDAIRNADRVVVVCSDRYVEKADEDPDSGVGQERALMSLELREKDSIKFFPILRDNSGGRGRRLPDCLRDRLWLDFTDDASFHERFERLVVAIRDGR